MKNVVWNKEEYQKFIKYLYSLQDLKYREFHSNLGINKDYLIGIRTPILKEIAKNISLGDYEGFIKYNTHNTYEERIIHGLIIGYIKEDFKSVQKRIEEFLPYIDNWAICDLMCANTKIWKKNTKEGLKFIERALKSKNIWIERVGIVLLLDYYINDEYIDTVLSICSHHKSDEYYVIMALAWTLSICYIKYPDKTSKLLESKVLDKKVQNKTIQKIRESVRIDKMTKKEIEKWRM